METIPARKVIANSLMDFLMYLKTRRQHVMESQENNLVDPERNINGLLWRKQSA
jgi:hypothetical protein